MVASVDALSPTMISIAASPALASALSIATVIRCARLKVGMQIYRRGAGLVEISGIALGLVAGNLMPVFLCMQKEEVGLHGVGRHGGEFDQATILGSKSFVT